MSQNDNDLKIKEQLALSESCSVNTLIELSKDSNATISFLEKISELESSLKKYHQTFFLDHAQEKFRFPTCFNSVIIRFILAHLGLGKKPQQAELLNLWQWKPQGYDFVPVIL